MYRTYKCKEYKISAFNFLVQFRFDLFQWLRSKDPIMVSNISFVEVINFCAYKIATRARNRSKVFSTLLCLSFCYSPNCFKFKGCAIRNVNEFKAFHQQNDQYKIG